MKHFLRLLLSYLQDRWHSRTGGCEILQAQNLGTILTDLLNRSQNSYLLELSCEELTHWKRLWCWEGLGTGGGGDDRGWGGWMASPTQWTWIWVNSGSWWWTGRPGVLPFMRSQGVRHNWVTELNWTELMRHVECFPEQDRTQTSALKAPSPNH